MRRKRRGKEPVSVHEIEESHRLAARRVDDVSVIDDLVVLAAEGPPARQVMRWVPPMNTSGDHHAGAHAVDGRSSVTGRCRTPCGQ